jgi:hypothetical protein
MHHDLSAMYDALRKRGFAPEEILLLEGVLTRRGLLDWLRDAHRRLTAWRQGDVFIYVSGHGFYQGTSVPTAQPQLLLRQTSALSLDVVVGWDEVFATLRVPAPVRLTVLPDT